MRKFQCEKCGDEQRVLAHEVGHYCPANIDPRSKQPRYTLYTEQPLNAPGMNPVGSGRKTRRLAPVVPVGYGRRSTKRGRNR